MVAVCSQLCQDEVVQGVPYVWMDGELVAFEQATTHVLSHTLHYGTGVFEGIRAYETTNGAAIFRLHDHMRRLVQGAKALRIQLEYSADDLAKACRELILANRLSTCYLRPIVFLGLGAVGVNPSGAQVHVAIATWQWGAYLGKTGVEQGIRVRISSWRRVDQAMMIPNAKSTGQYLNSVLARMEAGAAGYDEAVLLNAQGYVAEGSGENIFTVRDGVVRTPTTQSGALDGITRRTVMTLLRDEGLEVEETVLARSDLYYADEVFFAGTAAEITPIREVDDRPIADGKPGPITKRTQKLYMAAVRGELERYQGWLEYV